MTKQQALDTLFAKNAAIRALNMAETLIHWDAATSGVPEKSLSMRGAASGWLSGESFRRFIAPDTLECLETLSAHKSELNTLEAAMVRELGRTYHKMKAIPPEEFQAFMALVAESEPVWAKAREQRDFAMISPYYEKIFDFARRMCDWYGYEKHPYDALLDDFEKGASVALLDDFFGALREKISPLIKEISRTDRQPPEITGSFDIDKQRKLLPWLCDFVGYDRERGKVGEVEHPFCTTVNRHDVRITTKYHADSLLSALYSTIHESGHAVYEQNMAEELDSYALYDAASTGMHESQSRLYENIIGRSRAFAGILLPRLNEQFDYFADWNEDMLYRAVNIARPSLIRIEADELTYSLHIMVRYELEKALMMGEIKVKDLPGLWADKYEEILGIRPNNLAEGVLQDVHWSMGAVGYFPSYAMGTAYGAQLMHTIKNSIDVDAAVQKADIRPVTEWLKEKVHKHGALLLPDDVLRQATGESFKPGYYVDYLSEKFSDLYGL